MEICDFAFHRPATLAEACELGRRYGRDARYLAGGTELLPDLKQHRDTTQHLIALELIPGLTTIAVEENGKRLRIGALATLSEVAESETVRGFYPALPAAISTMAAVQIRNRGTLGGNFCGGVPSCDTAPIAIAGKAEVELASVGGTRKLPAEEFFLGPRKTVLEPGELLQAVLVPAQPRGSGADYQRFALRQATALAVVGVAAWIALAEKGDTIREARVALGAVAPVPMLAEKTGATLTGEAPSDELFERAAEVAASEARPITDLRGSADFRRQLVRVLTARALAAATAHARTSATR